MTTTRFNKIAEEEQKGETTPRCPKCKSKNLTSDAGLDMGMSKLGPNWLRCLDCESLFIRNVDEEETNLTD